MTEARFALIHALNLRGLVAGSAIMDYHKVADHVSVEEYVEDVIAGRRFDTNLSKQLKIGFRALAVIPDYVPDDWRTLGYGVTIVWDNPDYRPGEAAVQGFEPRQYALTLRLKQDPEAAA